MGSVSRYTIAELIEELRDAAEDLGPLDGLRTDETVEAQAAQALEELSEALDRIAVGVPDPKAVAAEALSTTAALKAINDPAAIIKRMLKPR